MSFSSKQLRDNEAKIQDNIYENIKLLTHVYPTSKEFNAVFKKNMFTKSNKAAFQHVIYYLFEILDPELTKEKMKSWPLYDVRRENVFRTEVVAFVSSLNSKHENSNLPNIMTSHLVTPGGFKFSKFMLKLSILTLHEHLSKNEQLNSELLSPITPCKDATVTKIMLKNLKTKTFSVENQVGGICEEFHLTHEENRKEAGSIIAEQTLINSELATQKKVLKEKKATISDSKTTQSLIDDLKSLQPQINRLKEIGVLCEEGSDLLQHLSSDKPVVHYKKDDFHVPGSVKHLFNTDGEELDLCLLFKSAAVLLENQNLEMPVFTKSLLDRLIRGFSVLNEKCSRLNQKFDTYYNDFAEISESLGPCVEEEEKNEKKSLL